MLFTSAAFFFLYLPVIFIGYYVIGRFSQSAAAGWLFIASLFFYGYWMPECTPLLLASIVWNYWVGSNISRALQAMPRGQRPGPARAWLIVGVSMNLAVLAYFKYAMFAVSSFGLLFGFEPDIGKIVLPIGISFFTFTQIAFLADTYLKGVTEYRFVHYGLFVTYFPHLVAGPVLHHSQMMPQFRDATTYRLEMGNVAVGLFIFAIGLFKKVVFADGVSPYADVVFDGASGGVTPDTVEAWLGALAYTFQLYFNFSGYSDMAIGLSLMLNVRLPYNFESPYKASSISEFWRRWHMTLSAFLRDYLYIALGGNRLGPVRRYMNLLITMLLGGLWHGANWTFVFWGGLHGFYLCINHAFNKISAPWPTAIHDSLPMKYLGWGLTFICTVIAWVFFRAPDFSSAASILSGMFPTELGQAMIPHTHSLLINQGLDPGRGVLWLAVLGGVALLFPNSNRIGEIVLAKCGASPFLAPFVLGASLVTSVFLVLTNTARDSVSAFIYFNF